jgi:uncharacterized protein (TIGR02147 family)
MNSKLKAKAPDIFDYHDYRSYLKDWLKAGRGQKISLRTLAAAARMSPAYLSMIISGARNLSDEALEKILPQMHLDEAGRHYFRQLKVIADSDSPRARTEALAKIQKSNRYRHRHRKELEVYRYLTNWYYVAIREAVHLPDFKLDPYWIQSILKFHVAIADIQKAIDFLVEYDFIRVAADGRCSLPQKQIDCYGGVYKVALAQFYRELFDLASQSIDATPREWRNITFHTMPFSKKNFEKLRALLDKSLLEIEQMGRHQGEADSVYHVTFSCFPLADSPGAKGAVK